MTSQSPLELFRVFRRLGVWPVYLLAHCEKAIYKGWLCRQAFVACKVKGGVLI